MGSLVDKLTSRQLITPPPFLKNNIQYEVIMGSVAYGVSSDTSDMDIYGFCVPPKYMLFPHLDGEIEGFGRHKKRFAQWQKHHVEDKSARIEYDFQIYSIVKYFHLCMENNPNMIDSLFVPRRCIIHSTQIGEHVREKRKEFLHKGSWHKFKGYAYSQVHKMNTKEPDENSNRFEMIKQFGFDVKFAYHVVRLLNEVEQILVEKDLDLQRNREQLKSIRKGDWTKELIINYFEDKEKSLEELYLKSDLPHAPDEERIKTILLECLEMHYGSLENTIKTNISIDKILDDMSDYIQNIRMMNK